MSAEAEIEGKRYRARQLLKGVLERMDQVEEDKRAMMLRCDDLENLLWENIDDGRERMSWEKLERSRMASRDMAPRRKRKLDAMEEGSEEDKSEKPQEEQEEGQIEDRPRGGADGWEALEADRDPTGALRGVVPPQPPDSAIINRLGASVGGPAADSGEVTALREKVVRLETDLAEYREGQKKREEQIVRACMNIMHEKIGRMVNEVSPRCPV
jgi:hypothetical protein